MLSACGRPLRAPTAVHFVAATTAASSRQRFGSSPVQMPNSMLPMKASPAPVVSTTASCKCTSANDASSSELGQARIVFILHVITGLPGAH